MYLFDDHIIAHHELFVEYIETSSLSLISHVVATYLDPGGLGDSKQYLKETCSTPQTPITGNHLDVPRSLDPNPNLLSPEILTQRRGNEKKIKK